MAETANEHQVAGNHYKAHGRADFQHWDLVIKFNLGYLEGQITRYLFRWRDKNGIEDLKKALHYLDKLIETWSTRKFVAESPSISCGIYLWDIVAIFNLDFFQGTILGLILFWREHSLGDLNEAHDQLERYIAIEESKLAQADDPPDGFRKAKETGKITNDNDTAVGLLFEALPYLYRFSTGETKIPSATALKEIVTRIETLLDTNIAKTGNHPNVGVSVSAERRTGGRAFNPPAGTR